MNSNDQDTKQPLIYAQVEAVVATAVAASTTTTPVAHSTIDGDVETKYRKYNYENENDIVVHEAMNVTAATVLKQQQQPPSNYPYTTPYDPNLERRIAEEATRRGRILSQNEINDLRKINTKAEVLNQQEQQKVHIANMNAQFQNYQEEKGFVQTSATVPIEAVAIPSVASDKKDYDGYHKDGTFGKGGYEVATYETSTYETTNYETSEYKSVYD